MEAKINKTAIIVKILKDTKSMFADCERLAKKNRYIE